MGLLNILSFKIGYLCAVRGYLKAAMKKGRPAWQQADYNEPNEEELTNAGKGVKGYLKDLWSSFILVNALLITASITPFSQAATQASTARGQSVVGAMMPDQNRTWLATAPVEYHHQAFGALWAITLSFSCVALTVSMLLLGYMLAVPDESVYTWAIQNGEKNHLALPAKFTLLGTLMFIFSVAYSAAVYYGLWVIPPVVLIFLFGLMAGFCGVFKFPWRGNKSNSNALGVAAAARQADKVKAAGKHSLPGHCGGFFGTSPSNDIDGQHPFSIVISNASVPGASQQSGQSKDVETKPEEEICA